MMNIFQLQLPIHLGSLGAMSTLVSQGAVQVSYVTYQHMIQYDTYYTMLIYMLQVAGHI